MTHLIFISIMLIASLSPSLLSAVEVGVKTVEKSMISSQKPSDDPIDTSDQSKVFQDASKSIMVMDKQQIKAFRDVLRDYSKATSYRDKLSKRSGIESIDQVTHISCVPGYVSTLNFIDAQGNPWPIEYILSSNDKVIPAGKLDPYTIAMTSAMFSGEINLIVKLKGIPLTYNLYVNASDTILDSNRRIRLHGQSPDYIADIQIVPISDVPSIKSDAFIMEQFLNDTPPQDAVVRNVNRQRVQVWSYKDKMYVRAPFILASPQAMADQGTAVLNGMYVYRLSHDVSRLSMLMDGQYFSVMVGI